MRQKHLDFIIPFTLTLGHKGFGEPVLCIQLVATLTGIWSHLNNPRWPLQLQQYHIKCLWRAGRGRRPGISSRCTGRCCVCPGRAEPPRFRSSFQIRRPTPISSGLDTETELGFAERVCVPGGDPPLSRGVLCFLTEFERGCGEVV